MGVSLVHSPESTSVLERNTQFLEWSAFLPCINADGHRIKHFDLFLSLQHLRDGWFCDLSAKEGDLCAFVVQYDSLGLIGQKARGWKFH